MFEWNYMEDKTPDSVFDNNGRVFARSFFVSMRKSAQGYSGTLTGSMTWIRGGGWVMPEQKEGVTCEVYAWAEIPKPAEYRNHESQ